MDEVEAVIDKLRYFEESPATREAGQRLIYLLQEARREADRKPDKLPLTTIVEQQFSPGFHEMTAHSHLRNCAVDISREIDFKKLWDIPANELGFRAANYLDEIYNAAVKKLGLDQHPNFCLVKTIPR